MLQHRIGMARAHADPCSVRSLLPSNIWRSLAMNDSFKARLLARELLLGTFVKSTDHTVTEVLSRSGLDVLCFDAEHVPFGAARLDTCLLAARANGMPAIVRVAD